MTTEWQDGPVRRGCLTDDRFRTPWRAGETTDLSPKLTFMQWIEAHEEVVHPSGRRETVGHAWDKKQKTTACPSGVKEGRLVFPGGDWLSFGPGRCSDCVTVLRLAAE